MNRASLLAHREEVLLRIAEGEKLVSHQEELVYRCRGAGLATERAEALLRALRAAQESYIAGLGRIDRQLAEPSLPDG